MMPYLLILITLNHMSGCQPFLARFSELKNNLIQFGAFSCIKTKIHITEIGEVAATC